MVTPRSTATWPSSGCSWPVIIRNSVVLPAPLGPTRPTFSPFWSAAEASMKRIWWPFCLEMLSRRIMGSGALEEGFGPALMPCCAAAEGCCGRVDRPKSTTGCGKTCRCRFSSVSSLGQDRKPVAQSQIGPESTLQPPAISALPREPSLASDCLYHDAIQATADIIRMPNIATRKCTPMLAEILSSRK